MFKNLLPLLLLGASFGVFAQSPGRFTLTGVVQDTSGRALPAATVMLLQPRDSALVNFGRADDNGRFVFRNIKNTAYLLKISYVGYLPFQQAVGPAAADALDLGVLPVKPIAKELIEVVIKAARAPLTIRGDTVEYNAASFRVPPGSTVEDLLRRLPGIEVDADGNIKAQGRDIRRVTVDGKSFFGDDPKAATKNLGAESISKVQVFNDKSDQAKLTGVDDGKREKTMNLELKDEFKKGSFGKITAAAGTQQRWASRGNYNRFNKTEQFSIIGYGNNINETGVNWEDYGEFKGNNSFNDFDNGDFGFGGGMRFYFMDGGGLLNNFDGRGFTRNAGAGVNYNYTHAKTKLSSSYFYNQTRLALDQFENRQTFVPGGAFLRQDTLARTDFRQNHSLAARLEQMLDSSNTLIVKGNLRFSGAASTDAQSQRFLSEAGAPRTRSQQDNAAGFDAHTADATAIYRHKFKRKGRNLALSGGFNSSANAGTERLASLNRFFEAADPDAQVRAIGQFNDNDSRQQQFKASALYLEPFRKKYYWETFYNVSRDTRTVRRDAFDTRADSRRLDSLSTYFTNEVLYNRLGTSLRYSHAGINVSAGVAALRYNLRGQYAPRPGVPPASRINRTFDALTPNLSAELQLKSNAFARLNYNLQVQAPQLNDLQPVVNNNNPFFITTGNPDLLPERSHSLGANFYKFNPGTFVYFSVGADYQYFLSRIIYTQTVNESLVTRTRPENIAGGADASVYVYAGMPVVKTKLNMNLEGRAGRGLGPTFINGQRNETDNRQYTLGLNLTITPNEKLLFEAGGRLEFNDVAYSIEQRQNQRIRNHSLTGAAKWNFAPRFFFESNLDYRHFRNDRFGFNQDIPLWNASVRRLLLKNNRLEVRLAAFDLLNQRRNVVQQGTLNFVSQQTALTLARYFMLSASYNVRGHADKLQKRGGW